MVYIQTQYSLYKAVHAVMVFMLHNFHSIWIVTVPQGVKSRSSLDRFVCQIDMTKEDVVGIMRHIRVTVLLLRTHCFIYKMCMPVIVQDNMACSWGILHCCQPHGLTGWVAACLGINWMGHYMCKTIIYPLCVKQYWFTI